MRRRTTGARLVAALALAASTALLGAIPRPAAAAPAPAAQPRVIDTLPLPDGSTATVYESGVVQLTSKDRRRTEYRAFPGIRSLDAAPNRSRLIADLVQGPPQPYARGTVLAVFAPGVTVARDVASAAARGAAGAAPALTSDAATNRLLARLGVDRVERLFRTFDRGALSAMRAGGALDVANAYRLHVTAASVPAA